jgi:L-alanine-DL-glutamate epimerase-like enolase superfamily enzyme
MLPSYISHKNNRKMGKIGPNEAGHQMAEIPLKTINSVYFDAVAVMKLSYEKYFLQFRHPFGVSGNTRKETPVVFLKIEAEDHAGYGEACLPVYIGETVEGTIIFLEKAKELLESYDPTLPLNFFLNETDHLAVGNNAAKASIDIALHDLYGKILGKSYAEMMGIPPSLPRNTSFTIALGDLSILEQKINEASDFSILKIKAGTEHDKALISKIRSITDKPLYVDANQGWKTKEEALEMAEWMREQNVILLEQPLPKEMDKEMEWLTERSPIPTIADESVKRLSDLEKLDGAFAGVNIKLMKCTGLREAMRMINYCKKNDLKILLGCMAESSCGATAMAQLMQFADYVDLDSPNLYVNDPFKGVTYQKGKVCLNGLPGIGAEPVKEIF